MDDLKYQQVLNTIFLAAEGDPSITTGLPAVDLKNPQLAFARALEICEKVKTLIEINPNHHYHWYLNLGFNNPSLELKKYWSQKQFKK